MELKQKGEQANVGGFKQLMIAMKWTTAADFDLAAAYEGKDGKIGLVYFGELGDLNKFPFMQLSGDEGVGDKGGQNEETMRIAKLDDLKNVWLICWDYGKVKDGSAARFKDSDVNLSIIDDKGTTYNVKLDTGDMGNVAVIATIDNTSAIGAKLVNTSKAGTLKGLKTLEDLMTIIRS
jgi:tellurite resistance protein TerA